MTKVVQTAVLTVCILLVCFAFMMMMAVLPYMALSLACAALIITVWKLAETFID